MMSDVHGISGVLNQEQGLRGSNSGERQVGLKAGFTPAIPQPCHFPSASQRGRGEGRVRGGGHLSPPREIKWRVEPKAGFTPAVPRLVTFQAPPTAAEERGGFRGRGRQAPPPI